LTSALLKNFAGSERKDVKESVRIEMKRKSEVRTKEEQREIAIIWRRTKNFVRIYEDTGIEKNRYQAAARARERHMNSLPFSAGGTIGPGKTAARMVRR